jgi:serine protease Do
MFTTAVTLLALALATSSSIDVSGDDVAWSDILAAHGEPPAPLPTIEWRTDLHAALAEAAEAGRPIFVTLRCLPCKQCSAFDAAVLEGGAELDPLLRQFITVRLTNAAQLDLRVLPAAGYQDLDLSWWGYILAPDAALYAIFGGRDHVSDETRISAPALARTLERVLRHHYDSRRASWALDAPAPALAGSPRPPSTLPGFASWQKTYPRAAAEQCLHCHQVAEVLRQPALDAGEFDKEKDLEPWPLPENIGIELDRDHGLLVTAIHADSPAAQAGLQPGDELGAAQGLRLFGQADLRGVLHRTPDSSRSIELHWLRAGEVGSGTIPLAPGWRATDLSWRMSVSQGNVGAAPGFWPLAGARSAVDMLSVRPWFGPKPSGPAYAAGLRGHHEITAIDGEHPNLFARPFLVWFRKRYDVGDTVTLTVRERGETKAITYRLGPS